MSVFDKAGLTVTFEGEQGVITKRDGGIVLTGRLMKGMYIVDELDDVPGAHLGVSSLSQPFPLEQLGVDYNETWAGVTRLESVRMTAAIAANLDLKLW